MVPFSPCGIPGYGYKVPGALCPGGMPGDVCPHAGGGIPRSLTGPSPWRNGSIGGRFLMHVCLHFVHM